MNARWPSVLDQDFLDKYFQIERANSIWNIGKGRFFYFRTYDVRSMLIENQYTIDFIIKSLVLSLIKKSIYRFSPENCVYCRYSLFIDNTFYVYKHKFSMGFDNLIANLNKRYGLDYTRVVLEGIDGYAQFTYDVIHEVINPICITDFKKVFQSVLNHKEFQHEFDDAPYSNSGLFYQALKLKFESNGR